MATNTIKARLRNKTDTYANWIKNDPVLLTGEIVIVEIPDNTNVSTKEPIRLLKVGDGKKKFSQLEFVGGYAADVYDWAKASVKPVYDASEITGLSKIATTGNVDDLTQSEDTYIIIDCGTSSTVI